MSRIPSKGRIFLTAQWLIFCLIIVTGNPVFSQPNKFQASRIPDSLLENAHIVIREKQQTMTVKDSRSAVMQYHEVYTILDKKGESELTFYRPSSSFRKLTDAVLSVYDAEGKLLHTYDQKDMSTSSFGEDLVDDGTNTYFRVNAPAYPITIQIDYQVKFKGLLQYPVYVIQQEDQAVEKSTFKITLPTALGFRYKIMQSDCKTVKSSNGALATYEWAVRNLKAKFIEPDSGPDYQYLPRIMMAANHFNMDGFEGDMSSWEKYGQWLNSLNGKDNSLSEKQVAFYQQLVKDAQRPVEKMRILYQYLQDNMRYVSIQLGIGGWKPFPASFVSDKKYGDCKALSNFMHVALNAVGIKSYPAIIHYGDSFTPISEDFPMSGFNHEILCIPATAENDTIWLECTSNSAIFGALSYNTADRPAVLLTPSGGRLVRTPAIPADKNQLTTTHHIHMDASGHATVSCHYEGTGVFREILLDALDQQTTRVKMEFVDKIGFKHTDSLEISTGKKEQSIYPVDMQMSYNSYPDFSTGNKLFIPARPVHLYFRLLAEDTERVQDYYYQFPYQLTDTTVIDLEGDLKPESLPEGCKADFPFGNYESRYSYDEAKKELTIISRLQILKTRIPAEKYATLYQFSKKADADMSEKIVVVLENQAASL